jgi:hypothetical protein
MARARSTEAALASAASTPTHNNQAEQFALKVGRLWRDRALATRNMRRGSDGALLTASENHAKRMGLVWLSKATAGKKQFAMAALARRDLVAYATERINRANKQGDTYINSGEPQVGGWVGIKGLGSVMDDVHTKQTLRWVNASVVFHSCYCLCIILPGQEGATKSPG